MKKFFIYFCINILAGTLGFSRLSLAVELTEKKIMDQARLAFEQSHLLTALEYYKKIPQSSDFWIEALEERAWTHLRMNQTAEALSILQTLSSDLLSPQLGPEPYLLYAMTEFKLCDVRGVFKSFQLFKTHFKERTEELNKLQLQGNNKSTVSLFSKLRDKSSQFKSLKADDFGSAQQYLPRFFYRDRTIMIAVETNSERRFTERLRQLAALDVKEIESILTKMHLLESQVVQQVFAYEKEWGQKRTAELEKMKDPNKLVFPASNEVWIDEIDGFDAATAICPKDPLTHNPSPSGGKKL